MRNGAPHTPTLRWKQHADWLNRFGGRQTSVQSALPTWLQRQMGSHPSGSPLEGHLSMYCCHSNSRKLSVSLHCAVWYVRHAPLHAGHQLRARKSTVATCCWTSRIVRGANTSWASRLAHASQLPLPHAKSNILESDIFEKSKHLLLKGRFEARREALHNLNLARAA
jgi:hypothetical protein